MLDKEFVKYKFSTLKTCVLIPTYNNATTLGQVITTTLEYCKDVIVVNDGATDETLVVLQKFNTITVLQHKVNQGKGMALRNGFKKALESGFEYVITIDSDGQHFPEDFITFLNKIEEQPGSLLIGARNMTVNNVPGKSTFGNKFSNFWFFVETGITLPDTQSGYRLYPVKRLRNIRLFTTKFEFEIEVIVKAAWRGIPVLSVPVKVYYAPQNERISHFRPGKDFVRISLLNTYLVILAALFWRPVMFIRSFTWSTIKNIWHNEIIAKHESPFRKASSVAVGLFFGIVPIWGFQFASALLVAYLFKLNKAVVGLVAQISIPPMIPFILYLSVKTGEFTLNEKVNLDLNRILTIDALKNLYVYTVGACVLSLIAAFAGFVFTYLSLKMFRYQPVKK